MREFEGKVAVVTGAASGMGRAFAERFAREGMKVVLADVEDGALEAEVQELRRSEFDVIGVQTDVSKPDSIEALAAKTLEAYGKIHVVCNNAGVLGASKPIWECSLKDWQWTLSVNLWGVIHGVHTFVPIMLAQDEEGHVINTASISGLLPAGGIYGVTKHGVVSLSETLYNQLRQREAKIGVSVLCPGLVATRLIDSDRNRPAHLREQDAEAGDRTAARERLAGGFQPAKVADFLLDAIREDRFWVLPHDEYDEIIQRRAENIIKRQNPGVRPPAR
jgi:NAD(P)-dependent dehydrogenase (short-subunit alcohol dehydrogenase family)